MLYRKPNRIGDPTGLLLWANDAVTATRFSMFLVLPALAAWVVPTYLVSRRLPPRIDIEWQVAPYRGDDTRLNRWQRILMLIVAIGGLWFVPTFLSITRLPAFRGALCVLSVLWVVNEAFNRKLDNTDMMSQRRIPRVIQYQTIQQILFIMGVMLGMGVVSETGVLTDVADWTDKTIDSLWVVGIVSAMLSGIVDSFMIAVSDISLYDVWNAGDYARDGTYWKVIAYCTAVGGCLLSVGNICGVSLMKMEHIHLGWYVKHITPKVFVGFIIGLIILFLECTLPF